MRVLQLTAVYQANPLVCLSLVALSASASLCRAQDGASEVSVRSFVETRCGAQLVAYEAGREPGTSIFRPDGATWDGPEPVTSADLAVGSWGSLAFSGIHDLVKAHNSGMGEGRTALAARLAETLALADCLSPSEAERHAVQTAGRATGGISTPGSLPSIDCVYDRLREAQSIIAVEMDEAALDRRIKELRDDDTCMEGDA